MNQTREREKPEEPNSQFINFYNLYYPRMLRYARRILSEDSAAEDAVQKIFTICWERFEEFDPVVPNDFWIFRIAENVCHQERRRISKWRSRFELFDSPEPTGKQAEFDELSPVERHVFHREVSEALFKMVDTLDSDVRQVFELRLLGYTFREIASKLGISRQLAQKRMSIGVRAAAGTLRQLLE